MDTERPDAEVAIDADIVRRLLSEQYPRLAAGRLELVGEGWDNVTYRVAERWAVRLPRREAAVRLLLIEQRWLPLLAPKLDIAVPEPVYSGRPGGSFPWPWSVVPWIDGATADRASLAVGEEERLAHILRRLHVPAHAEAPVNPWRGVPLRERSAFVQERLARLPARERGLATKELRSIWDEGVGQPDSVERVWIHGDLHPRNVLGANGRIVALLDWGDMCGGDPATDLAAAWTLLETEAARARFWEVYAGAPSLVARARAWAVFFGVALSQSGEPRHEAVGYGILDRLPE